MFRLYIDYAILTGIILSFLILTLATITIIVVVRRNAIPNNELPKTKISEVISLRNYEDSSDGKEFEERSTNLSLRSTRKLLKA